VATQVRQLRLAWKARDPDYITQAPLVANGRVFLADWGGVVSAVDARTGLTLWMTEAEEPRRQRSWHGFGDFAFSLERLPALPQM
jgi:outer membrane protein assembly factor BamB